jgi:hypothetical protein
MESFVKSFEETGKGMDVAIMRLAEVLTTPYT